LALWNIILGGTQYARSCFRLAFSGKTTCFSDVTNELSAISSAANSYILVTLVRAMIAAARSDGRLDAKESQAIFQRIDSLPLAPDNKAFLIEEIGRPVDMDAIINSAKSPEVAAEIYIASPPCSLPQQLKVV
jgi:uncharacterized membrane protein YebE (DUF533 family)